uniref:rhodanese-like domain-containing protein n=1 Tax=Eubacterium sp. TaxID=142586 RepID=UPI003FF100FD
MQRHIFPVRGISRMMNYDRIIFYCDHGNHSLQAARELAKKGKWASSIAGGYEEMKK